jgi:hypothetical protein
MQGGDGSRIPTLGEIGLVNDMAAQFDPASFDKPAADRSRFSMSPVASAGH